MYKVRVVFRVKQKNSVSMIPVETTVNLETLILARGDVSREKLSGWAVNFFPGCEWAKVISIIEL